MENKNIAIDAQNINKTFYIKDKNSYSIRNRVFNIFSPEKSRTIQALTDINFQVYVGEFFGIIGRNGSGKSTILKILNQVYPPNRGGKLTVKGQSLRLALGTGFDGELTAKENIYLNASLLGITFKQIGRILNEIIVFAELEEFINTKVKYYSSGMKSRLAFAIAVNAEADIFLMDEFFGGVGDEQFRRKSDLVFIESFIKGRTIIFVSHNMEIIKQYCNRVLLLDKGKMISLGKPEEVIDIYNRLMHK